MSAQAQTNTKEQKPATQVEDPDNLAKEYFSQIMGVALSATSNLKLYEFVYDWIGTPYRLGGGTKKGIDCSGFAFELYNKVFSTLIGSNSRNIFSMVNPINKEELKEGDTIGDYAIHKVLGKGGYSKVFKVKHRLQDKFYTLKLFNESVNISSVKDEYAALIELQHNNIVFQQHQLEGYKLQ